MHSLACLFFFMRHHSHMHILSSFLCAGCRLCTHARSFFARCHSPMHILSLLFCAPPVGYVHMLVLFARCHSPARILSSFLCASCRALWAQYAAGLRLWLPKPPYACAKCSGYGGQSRHTPARNAPAMAASRHTPARKAPAMAAKPPYACANCAMCSPPALAGSRLARIRAAAALWHFRCHTRGNARAAAPSGALISPPTMYLIAPKATNPDTAKNKKCPGSKTGASRVLC